MAQKGGSGFLLPLDAECGETCILTLPVSEDEDDSMEEMDFTICEGE